ncbi:MAG TPA: hypothetical protein VFQ61_10920 [Polyangiaceae bacterium]|nr:hypothetical protein [Polyangiaceae bacterium]
MKRATSFACALLLLWEGVARADDPQASPPAGAGARPATAPSLGAAPTQTPIPAPASAGSDPMALPPSSSSASSAAAAEPDALPPPSARPLVLLAGVGTFALWYGAALAQSYAWPKADEADKLRIPVAGPWMTLAHAGCSDEEPKCTTVLGVVRGALAGLSGIGQVGGLALLSEALFLRTGSSGSQSALETRSSAPIHASVKGVTFATERDGLRVGVYGSF